MKKLPEDSIESLSGILFPKSIPNYFSRFRNLVKLECQIDCFTDKCIEILTKLEHIKDLDISVIKYLLTSTEKKCFKNLRILEKFKINSNGEYYNNIDSLLVSVKNCKNLKYLDISYCDFTKVGIVGLSSLQNLTELNISFTICDKKIENLTEFIEQAYEIKNNRGDKHILLIYCNNNNSQEIVSKNFAKLSPLVSVIVKNEYNWEYQ